MHQNDILFKEIRAVDISLRPDMSGGIDAELTVYMNNSPDESISSRLKSIAKEAGASISFCFPGIPIEQPSEPSDILKIETRHLENLLLIKTGFAENLDDFRQALEDYGDDIAVESRSRTIYFSRSRFRDAEDYKSYLSRHFVAFQKKPDDL